MLKPGFGVPYFRRSTALSGVRRVGDPGRGAGEGPLTSPTRADVAPGSSTTSTRPAAGTSTYLPVPTEVGPFTSDPSTAAILNGSDAAMCIAVWLLLTKRIRRPPTAPPTSCEPVIPL